MLFIGSAIALVTLILDILLTIKGNMPINNMINTWTEDNYPADWQLYRAKWLSIFEKRQIANIIGFLCLLMGTVFG
jgi:hypothetical protein